MAKGISTQGDVLVNQTADGVDLNTIWAEIADALALYNTERSAVTRLLSYPTTVPADAVPQSVGTDSFEEATEFGVPRAIRPPSDVLKLGYTWKDWDISLRATWKFLRDATAEQVTAQVTRVLEADNKLGTARSSAVCSALRLSSTTGSTPATDFGARTAWCPRRIWARRSMARIPTTSRSGVTVIDSQDIEVDDCATSREHGYGQSPVRRPDPHFRAPRRCRRRSHDRLACGHGIPHWRPVTQT